MSLCLHHFQTANDPSMEVDASNDHGQEFLGMNLIEKLDLFAYPISMIEVIRNRRIISCDKIYKNI